MSIPRRTPETQHGTPPPRQPVPCAFSLTITDLASHELTLLLQALEPANETEPPPCPTCGRAYDLFWLPGSQLLDLVEAAKLALTDLQAAIEEEVLP